MNTINFVLHMVNKYRFYISVYIQSACIFCTSATTLLLFRGYLHFFSINAADLIKHCETNNEDRFRITLFVSSTGPKSKKLGRNLIKLSLTNVVFRLNSHARSYLPLKINVRDKERGLYPKREVGVSVRISYDCPKWRLSKLPSNFKGN
jgi:hypothetical protein